MCYTGLFLGLFWNLVLHWLVLGPIFLKQHFGILYYTGLILDLLKKLKNTQHFGIFNTIRKKYFYDINSLGIIFSKKHITDLIL